MSLQHLKEQEIAEEIYEIVTLPKTKSMTIKEITNTIIRGEKALKFPLKYDDGGLSIWDADMNRVLDIRGWGHLQYHPEGENAAAALQDAIGEWIVETLNKEYESSIKLD